MELLIGMKMGVTRMELSEKYDLFLQ